MSYFQIKTKVNSVKAEYLSDTFLEYGALSSSIEDAYADTLLEQPLFDESINSPIWQECMVIALFQFNSNLEDIVKQVFHACNLNVNHPYESEKIDEQDWVKKTQSQFGSIEISKRLWIVPSWEKITKEESIVVCMDPGLAFGTGTHPTTFMCLKWLDQNIKGGESLLDYGCGSGILAITAAKLGAQRVVGIDIDEQAVLASTENAANNKVDAQFYLADKNAFNATFQIVMANILTNSLKFLSELLTSHVKQKGFIVLSGILKSQVEEIIDIYGKSFTIKNIFYEDDWACIVAQKS